MARPVDWLFFSASYNFVNDLCSMMNNWDAWLIDDTRIVHDTGLWVEVDHVINEASARRSEAWFVLNLGLTGTDPIQIKIAANLFEYTYDHLVQHLRKKESQVTLDKIKVLVTLSADASAAA